MPASSTVAVQFGVKPGGGRLFYARTAPAPEILALGLANPSMLNLRAGWLAPADFTAPKDPVPFSRTWTLGGIYLFLGGAVNDESGFVSSLRHIAATPQFQAVRLLWIANPNARQDQWRVWSIRLNPAASSQATIAAQARFDFRNHALTINEGCSLKIVDAADQSGFQIDPPAASTGALLFSGVESASVFIPMWDSTGCLHFPIHLTSPELFDVGLRYSFPGRLLLGKKRLTSFRYPVFSTDAALNLAATVDPIQPLDSNRTFFDFTTAPPQVLGSFFRTNAGHPMTLTPVAGARLLFGERPTYLTAGTEEPLYLVPDGPFAIQPATPPLTAPARLLCGIFGAEFVELDSGAHITFTAGQPAHLRTFQPGTGFTDGLGNAGAHLSSYMQTSGAFVHSGNSTLKFSAVPEGAGFYNTAGAGMLDYFPAVSAFLPLMKAGDPRASASPHPLVPCAGVQAPDSDSLRILESQIFAPLRRIIIQQNQAAQITLPAPRSNDDLVTLTPQGLNATFDAQGNQWKRLQIAQTGSGNAPVPLTFDQITDPLRSALLTNQQFLVITDAARFAPFFSANTVVKLPSGGSGFWTFKLDPLEWSKFGTILVIKNSARALAGLIEDLNAWTLGSFFNASLSGAQNQLRSAVQVGSGDEFNFFNQKVLNSPDWNGILFLRCPVDSGGLPDDLQGLAGGIDPGQFFAHHLGVNQTPVKVDAQGAPVVGQTSVFGLIDYQDNSVPPGFSEFSFRAKSISVLFRNSVVEKFSSAAEFGIARLFGAPAGPVPPLLLQGTYEQHGDRQVFAMSGQSEGTPVPLTDAVLTSVNIVKTHLSTSVTNSGEISSRLDLWGTMRLASLKDSSNADFDLFSYDALRFSNLGVTMTFPKTNPQAKIFAFDASRLNLDDSQSAARDGSLAKKFPVTLKSFVISKDQSDPTSAGFLEVGLPFAGIGGPWYGILYALDLGTVGALAANAGIVADFGVFWSPGATSPAVFAGLKLPLLSGGHNKLSLLGILTLSMSSVDLLRDRLGGFQLALNGMTLKFLSKSLPPGASFDFYLAGNEASKKIGWYGAYVRQQS